ncbi:acetate--CoA ligase family protein [Aquisalimonas lutea]|uniref:acetate--CoA ligase family protein n=1 Tax=Aquisalimonas lutea TaxID=1327750 RepID=UPI0025B3B9CB|nr:acetate--CoA ligase family protein [Aquisalimonas lutea]MDN3519806.1 acetate--CoA ligase family protein [Aquisalimonas lutea]
MRRLLSPSSIAVVGASTNPKAIGGQPIRQLFNHGYSGRVLPVNPNRDTVQELECFPSVSELPGDVDVALIAVPAPNVEGVVEECGKKGIPYAVVLSSGFADAGGDGIELQERLVKTAQKYGVRILGPNCVGYISMTHNFYGGFGAFFDYQFASGPVGFVTQSGGVGGGLLTILEERGIRFSHFLHTGNAADIDIETGIEAFVDDPDTNVILAYLEGLANNSRFRQVAERALVARKPIIAWKAGKSARSGTAVVSHTGRMAGDIDRYRAVFERYGVVEVDDTEDLSDTLKLAQMQCIPHGRRVGIVSVSGGAGVIAADCLEEAENVELVDFKDETERKISELLPGFATSRNPIDVTAQIFNEPDLFEKVVGAVCEENEVDVIVTCIASVHGEVGETIARAIADTQSKVGVPIVTVWASRDELNAPAFRILDEKVVPIFRSPERALRALDRVAAFGITLTAREKEKEARPTELPERLDGQYDASQDKQLTRLTEFDTLEMLRTYGVAVPEQRLVTDEGDVSQALKDVGTPVVMKVQSPDIAHKAEIGGVALTVESEDDAITAYRQIMDAASKVSGAEIRGVVMQRKSRPGVEIICGYVRDAVLGDFLLCGGGGTDVEKKRDVQLIPMPATTREIRDKVRRVHAVRKFESQHHQFDSLITVISALQQFALDHAGDLGEPEINPVIINEDSVIAVDALAIARK